ncbi:cupin domain-containing protein [Variovorax dokdonensis]|uniref:Cupin domain-containing protein n=1 Tax=Variovorax dokdonensis TaxID=344883 RepID=A0ABT7NHC2_9BURK|nr:cupin domain-containing protein [Variovorax dokdonensis]MDM0047357.1 cupin domain-containing protein [Variovorax dokdonensis]
MDIRTPLALLGGLSPQQFMRRHWQKKPLLVRAAVPNMVPPIPRSQLFDLAGQESVESRLVRRTSAAPGWSLRHGPFTRRQLPSPSQAAWTLLVQGVDLHDDRVHQILRQFRFLPDARLDDLMISYASDQGSVGPHFDSYDVFLLQASGRRRWSIGRQPHARLVEGLPLKIIDGFEPEESFVLEPGDMLYLPPRYAHDGIAEGGDCMTYSIGLRSPARAALGADLLARVAEAQADELSDRAPGTDAHYRDPAQAAVENPGAIPPALQAFAREAIARALRDPLAIDRALGESMTEPKPDVWFDLNDTVPDTGWQHLTLDRRTRMLYDERHVYINGESFRAGGRDATLMRRLADQRELDARQLSAVSEEALELLRDWCDAGWAHAR